MREIIKHRKVKISGSGDKSQMILESIKNLVGVKKAEKTTSGQLELEYDLMHINFKDIRHKLEDNGIDLSKSALNKMKNGWIDFTETNERDNATAPTHSCCSDPKEAERIINTFKGKKGK